MTLLRSFATDYNGTEDRIRLRCAFADGAHATLWMTQRLVNRLAQHLEGMLAERGAEAAVAPPTGSQATPPPPEAECGRRQWLVETVDISGLASPTRPIQITFRNTTSTALITMEAPTVRQWLDCLRRLYEVAQWPPAPWSAKPAAVAPAAVETPPAQPPRRQRTH